MNTNLKKLLVDSKISILKGIEKDIEEGKVYNIEAYCGGAPKFFHNEDVKNFKIDFDNNLDNYNIFFESVSQEEPLTSACFFLHEILHEGDIDKIFEIIFQRKNTVCVNINKNHRVYFDYK